MIRVATLADCDRLVELEQVCEGADAWSPALVHQGVAGLLETTTWLVVQAEDDTGVGPLVIGYAVLSVVADVAELQRIGVDPDHRRGGLGRELLDRVVIHAGERGAADLLLEVRESNTPARRLYDAAGFEQISQRRGYYRDGETAAVLSKRLTPASG